jgi:transposase
MSVTQPQRFIGLDIHKHYCVAAGVNAQQEEVFVPRKVRNHKLKAWANTHLTKDDAIVIEMTTNTYQVHDLLLPLVHSVTVVHPPHVALIARAQVKTDKRDALNLAKLHAANLLPAVWIPPQEVRDQRALVAQRWKMVQMRTIAKNRLHSFVHRGHLVPPEGGLFAAKNRSWWDELDLPESEMAVIESDLDTLAFADRQVKRFEERLGAIAAQDPRMPLLAQLPGISLVTGMTILAAVGTIERFEHPRKLVGYAGLGGRVNQSGKHYYTGGITKRGRKDLRHAMVEIARAAVRTHPRWKAEYERLSHRIGKHKAVVAVARKMLVVVWCQ